MAALLAGCAVPGAIAYKVFGPPAIPARYTPPKTEPLVVLVEDAHSAGAGLPEAEELLQALNSDLTQHKVAPMVDPRKVHDLRDLNTQAFSKMSISEIGRRVGAKKIIYVNITQCDFVIPPSSDVMKLKLTANIKVVDAYSAEVIWPNNIDGEVLHREGDFQRMTADMTASNIRREALKEIGEEISRMFYEYKTDTMGEENKDVRLR